MAQRIGEMLGWGNNPFYSALSGNRNALMGLGAGIASGTDFGEGIANGLQLAQRGAVADDAFALQQEEEATRLAQINQTAAYLREQGAEDLAAAVEGGMMSGGDAFSTWYSAQNQAGPDPTANMREYDYARQTGFEGSFADWVNGGGTSGSSQTEYGLTPIWGQFKDGTFGYGVQGKDGTFRQVDTGDLSPLDPRTLAGERAFGTQMGNAQGQGAASAPSDVTNALTALDILDQIETSPELPWATGTSAGLGGNKMPGTGRYGFQNIVDQAKSGAFLSAIQQMRGMGALSNAEGQVATAAITRMDTALSEADFRKALADYRAVIQTGLERAQGRVGMQPNVNAPGSRPAAQTSSGIQWSIEP